MSRDLVNENSNKNNKKKHGEQQKVYILFMTIQEYSYHFESCRMSHKDGLLGALHLVVYLSGDILLDFEG